jgi:light-regulated signal transduction histidine kinase (bacteriophytochrome)
LRDLGWAAVHYVPVTSALALLDTPTRAILSASVALAALMGIGVFVSIRRSVAPLTRLTAAAQTVGTGDFSQRIEARSGDEIGELAAEFNRMAGALAEKDAQVRGHATELAHSNAELERANRELEAFTYSVSHDLRAPLRSVNSFSKVLLEDYADKLDDEGKDDLRRVYAATQRMGQLIDDLLKLSRIGRAEITVEAVDLSALARSVVAELKESDPARNVEFDIPPTADARGDKRLLTILLENLLGNAWKFTSKHESARIEFGVTTQDGAQVYFVRDDGAGFDMAYVDNLFAPFQRLHRAADFPGTGVGLATVGRIVEHHGGRVWAEGAVEQGATFYFTLAREPAAEAGAAGGKSRWRLQ